MDGTLGVARGSIQLDVGDALAGVDKLSAGLRGLDRQQVGQALGKGLVGMAAGIAAGIGLAVNTTAKFDTAMSGVAATLGSDAAPAMGALRDLALEIGAATSKSASESALAMEELAKAGVSAEDILGGAAYAAVALSEATGADLATSANVAANAMNVFGHDAGQLGADVDIITAAVNNSSADIGDFQAGLRNLGPVVANLGGDLDDTAAAVAYFTNFGLKGADAGVSLARGLQMAAKPTAEAQQLMTDLGISVYDAQGQFVGFPALFDSLQSGLGDVDDATREAAIATIFGAEAADVMAIAVKNGADGYEEMLAAVQPTGQAAETAAERLNNLGGDVEKLAGSFETAQIKIGSVFTPVLRVLVQALTEVVDAFNSAPPVVQALTGILLAATGAVAGLVGGYLLLGPKIKQALALLRLVAPAILGVSAPILLVVAALALLGAAYATNFGGFADLVDGAVAAVGRLVGRFAEAYAAARTLRGLGNVGAVFAALGIALDEILGTDVSGLFYRMGKAAGNVGEGVGRVVRQFGRLSKIIRRDGLAEGLERLFAGDIGKKMLSGLGDVARSIPETIGTALAGITTGFAPLDGVFRNLGASLVAIGKLFEAVFDGDLGRALELGKGAFRRYVAAFTGLAGIYVGLIRSGLAAVDWGALWDLAKAGILAAVGGVLDLGRLGLAAALGLAGDLRDLAGRGLGWVADQIPKLGSLALSLGKVALTALVSLAGTLLSLATRGLGWVAEQIPKLGSLALSLGKVAITAVVSLVGTLLDLATRGLGWVADQIVRAGALSLSLGSVAVAAAVSLAGDLLALSTRGLGWVADQIVKAGSLTLSLGTAAVTATVDLAGDLLALATRGLGWVADQIPKAGSLALRLGTALVTAVVDLAGTLASLAPDAWAWVVGQIENTLDHSLALGSLAITAAAVDVSNLVTSDQFAAAATAVAAGIVAAVTGLTTLGADIGGAVAGKIRGIAWGELITADSFNLGQSFGAALRSAIGAGVEVATGIASGIGDAIGKLNLEDVDWASVATKIGKGIAVVGLAAPAAILGLGVAIASFIGGAITGLVFGEGDADWAGLAGKIGTGIVSGLTNLATLGADLAVAIGTAVVGADYGQIGSDIASGIWEAMTGWFSSKSITDILPGGDDDHGKPDQADHPSRPNNYNEGSGGPGRKSGISAAEGFLQSFQEKIGGGALAGAISTAFGGAAPAANLGGQGVGTAGSGGVLIGFQTDIPGISSALGGAFDAGKPLAEGSGAAAGSAYAAAFALAAGAPGKPVGGPAPAQGAGQITPPQGSQTAPAPVVVPPPDTTRYVAGLLALGPMTQAAIAQVGVIAAATLAAQAGAFQGGAMQLVLAAAQGIRAGGAQIPAALVQVLQAGRAAMLGQSGAFQAAGLQLTSATAAGAQAGTGVLVGALVGAVSAAAGSAAGQAHGLGVPIGMAIDEGVAAGVNAGSGVIAAAVVRALAAGIAAGKQSAGINSPSDVAADELGEPLPEGVAEGIWAKAAVPARAMRDVLARTLGVSPGTLGALGMPLAGAAGAGSVTNITVYALDPDSYGRILDGAQAGDAAYRSLKGTGRRAQLAGGRTGAI